jgi:hypothetical protein
VSSLPCAVRLAHLATLLLGVSLSARAATAPTASDLARCAAMAAPDARLACYDSLSAAATPIVPASTPAPTVSARPAAPKAASVAASKQAPAPATTTPAAPSEDLNDPRNFGLNAAQLHAPPPGPQSIQARVAKVSRGRVGTAYVVLDNGQTWTYTDEDSRLGPGDLVTIKRAVLGSFLMTTPSKRSYHVQRVQ